MDMLEACANGIYHNADVLTPLLNERTLRLRRFAALPRLASISIAMAMGIALRHGEIPIGLVSAFGVSALLLSVFAGQFFEDPPLEHEEPHVALSAG